MLQLSSSKNLQGRMQSCALLIHQLRYKHMHGTGHIHPSCKNGHLNKILKDRIHTHPYLIPILTSEVWGGEINPHIIDLELAEDTFQVAIRVNNTKTLNIIWVWFVVIFISVDPLPFVIPWRCVWLEYCHGSGRQHVFLTANLDRCDVSLLRLELNPIGALRSATYWRSRISRQFRSQASWRFPGNPM